MAVYYCESTGSPLPSVFTAVAVPETPSRRPIGGRTAISFFERVIDQFLESGCDACTFLLGLFQENVDHIELRIDAEVSAAAAVPLQFANRAGRRRFRIPRIGPDPQTITIPKTIARKVEIIPLNARARTNMVGGHLRKRRRAEILLAVEFSAVAQHLRKSRIVGDGRDQPAAARFPFRVRPPRLLRALQNGIIRQRLRHARPFCRTM